MEKAFVGMVAAVAAILGCGGMAPGVAEGAGEAPEALRVFYFGNSLTAATRPQWHAELGRSRGKDWRAETFLGAGWQSWQHRNELFRVLGVAPGNPPESAASRGDLTLAAADAGSPAAKVKAFLEGEWDAVVIQVFGQYLKRVTTEQWGRTFEQPIDVGDVGAISDLIRVTLARHPEAKFFIYTVWPPMPPGEEREVEGKKVRGAEFPRREEFEYERFWLAEYPGDGQGDRNAPLRVNRTRDYMQQVVAGVRANFPELAAAGRLEEIPGGDLFLALDRKMRAGRFPGHTTIEDFYTDIQHIRAGLAQYAVACLFYAALFGESPAGLAAQPFWEQEAYGPDPSNDFGAVIPMSPEQAEVVWATVQEVLAGRPVRPTQKK